MKPLCKMLFVVAMLGTLAPQAWGDGKVFVYRIEHVPAHIPYQRAFIFFDEGSETLVVQSKYELPESAGVSALGWVVPVPAVPELASIDADMARGFFRFVSVSTSPHIIRISAYLHLLPVAFLIALVALSAVDLLKLSKEKPDSESKVRRTRQARNMLVMMVLILLFMTIFVPHLGGTRHLADVEILKAERVGIYDVTVIRGDSAEAVTQWLDENEFGYDETDRAILADYVDRGWCFVTAKIVPEAETDQEKIVSEAMVAPLILTFPTDKPVYPLALTANASDETELLIYTLSDNKLTCNDRLKLHHAKKTSADNLLMHLYMTEEANLDAVMDSLPDKNMMLCKFKGTLTSVQMKEDLVFEPADDNIPYRDREIIW